MLSQETHHCARLAATVNRPAFPGPSAEAAYVLRAFHFDAPGGHQLVRPSRDISRNAAQQMSVDQFRPGCRSLPCDLSITRDNLLEPRDIVGDLGRSAMTNGI